MPRVARREMNYMPLWLFKKVLMSRKTKNLEWYFRKPWVAAEAGLNREDQLSIYLWQGSKVSGIC